MCVWCRRVQPCSTPMAPSPSSAGDSPAAHRGPRVVGGASVTTAATPTSVTEMCPPVSSPRHHFELGKLATSGLSIYNLHLNIPLNCQLLAYTCMPPYMQGCTQVLEHPRVDFRTRIRFFSNMITRDEGVTGNKYEKRDE